MVLNTNWKITNTFTLRTTSDGILLRRKVQEGGNTSNKRVMFVLGLLEGTTCFQFTKYPFRYSESVEGLIARYSESVGGREGKGKFLLLLPLLT